jgi:pseudolysin
VTRQDAQQMCFLQNSEVTVINEPTDKVISYKCHAKNSEHNNVYWDGQLGAVNGGYSPGNDALFGGYMLKQMYRDWYNIPVLSNSDGSPMMLNMVVHSKMDNAYWSSGTMVFGDGIDIFYPLTSIGVAAHEISHGFTEQHSELVYFGQSGGMNESFSDMAAQAAEVYAYGPGKNNWQIGSEIFKEKNAALRYMDLPSKDCRSNLSGRWCSINDASQYHDDLDVHHSSGVYNRLFYLIATSPSWNVRKAFDVMVDANRYYWVADSSFIEGACGILQATHDRGFDLQTVKSALKIVKIDYSRCKIAA